MRPNPPHPTAHGVTHTRPIVARGEHFNAANDEPSEEEKLAADVRYMQEMKLRDDRRIAETARLERTYHEREGRLV